MGRKIIVVGDPTDHGGRVISGSPTQKINGKAIARLGDQVNCPKKGHGVNAIVEGDASMLINGIANLKVLEGKGYKLDGLNDMDKAKLMYLMHHEGEGQGPNFVGNTLDADRLRSVFRLQTKKDGEWIERAKGNVADGYRAWFADYVDTKFRGATKEYFCPEKPAVISADLTKILVAIGGKEIPDVKTP